MSSNVNPHISINRLLSEIPSLDTVIQSLGVCIKKIYDLKHTTQGKFASIEL